MGISIKIENTEIDMPDKAIKIVTSKADIILFGGEGIFLEVSSLNSLKIEEIQRVNVKV